MNKKEKLAEMAKKVAICQQCPLFRTATNPVPGNGNPEAKIVLVGEAPGYWEDQKGIPFCGAAGDLLNQLLASIKIKRGEVFVCNILKHRPPQNREPLPSEIKACTLFLKEQLLIIKPKVIITLGRFAMNYFLPTAYISRIHGKVQKVVWEGLNLTIIPMFHPAAALRGNQVMIQLQNDFLQIPPVITCPPPQPKQESLWSY